MLCKIVSESLFDGLSLQRPFFFCFRHLITTTLHLEHDPTTTVRTPITLYCYGGTTWRGGGGGKGYDTIRATG